MDSASAALLPANDIHLQPVSLNYAERSHLSVVPVCKAQRTRLRVTRRVTTTPRVLSAQRARDNQLVNEVIPPQVVLSNFPIDLTSSAPVLVVFQGEQFGPNGPIFWRVTILHLTPTQQRIITGGIPKQI